MLRTCAGFITSNSYQVGPSQIFLLEHSRNLQAYPRLRRWSDDLVHAPQRHIRINAVVIALRIECSSESRAYLSLYGSDLE